MTYTHLTTDELVMIESYYHKNISVAKIAIYLNRTRTPIYTVINFLKEGHTALEYYQQYKENKSVVGVTESFSQRNNRPTLKIKSLKVGLLMSLLVGRKSPLSVLFVPFTANSKKKSLMKPHSQ